MPDPAGVPEQDPLPGDTASTEVILVVRPAPQPSDPVGTALRSTVGMLGGLVSLGQQLTSTAANAALDRIVPVVVDAVLDRIDLTEVIVDRVDIDRIVARADLGPIIDRLPLVQIADYVIDEIDLPQIIRDSTGGIASEAMNVVRMQSIGVDQMVSKVIDAMLLRRASRNTKAADIEVEPDQP